ncbi:MAG TPA: AMP-binding protein, partial [Bordetella sp.]|nr:AMP-binding protein [Bordetella sp.]
DAHAGESTWDAAIAAAPPDAPSDAATPQATCVFIYTSGTTGLPKAVMHTQRSVVLSGEGFVGRMHLQPQDRLLCILPTFHINALFYSVCGSLAAGAAVILEEGFSASRFWATVKESGATEVNFVAAIPGILAKRPRTEFVAGHCLAKICVAPLSQETETLFTETFGVRDLLDGYGMSEAPGVCITPLQGQRRRGSVGRLCRHPDPDLRFAELRVVDEAGNDLPAGQVGELMVRTPTLMQGYFRDPEQTRAAFRDGGWFITGDLGYRDADDFIWFVGRKKDIIRKRGENISGAELDRVVGNHPAVQEAAAIAVPAELGEDEVLVAVVLRPGQRVAAREIADWCAARLARIKVPRYVVFVDDLPHTATHRVEKHKLKKDPALLARAIDLQEPTRG